MSSHCIMCVQYIRGCSEHRGDIMSTSGDVRYIRGISWVHRGMFSASGDIMMHVGEQVGKNLSISIENPDVLNIPQCTEIPRCTEHHLMYTWYPPHASWYPPNVLNTPDVLMISPWCTHGIPPMYWTSPDVLMISPDVLMISPDVLMISPHVLMISPDVLMVSQMYWTSPDVLNTHYIGWSSDVHNWLCCLLQITSIHKIFTMIRPGYHSSGKILGSFVTSVQQGGFSLWKILKYTSDSLSRVKDPKLIPGNATLKASHNVLCTLNM